MARCVIILEDASEEDLESEERDCAGFKMLLDLGNKGAHPTLAQQAALGVMDFLKEQSLEIGGKIIEQHVPRPKPDGESGK